MELLRDRRMVISLAIFFSACIAATVAVNLLKLEQATAMEVVLTVVLVGALAVPYFGLPREGEPD